MELTVGKPIAASKSPCPIPDIDRAIPREGSTMKLIAISKYFVQGHCEQQIASQVIQIK
jgi:hypothetical protein